MLFLYEELVYIFYEMVIIHTILTVYNKNFIIVLHTHVFLLYSQCMPDM
jgi:hypothetical protein